MEKSTKRDRPETAPPAPEDLPGAVLPEESRDYTKMREKIAVYENGYANGYADARYHLLLYATGFILGALIARSVYRSMETGA